MTTSPTPRSHQTRLDAQPGESAGGAEVPEAARGSAESGRRIELGYGETTMWVAGEVDISNADEFYEALAQRADTQPDRLLLDMSGVTFIDSMGLRALVTASQKVPIQIARPSEFVAALLFMNGLEDSFGV